MNARGMVIAALVAVELAICGEAVVAVGGHAPAQHLEAPFAATSGPRLREGGPHRIFDSGAHPALVVDIGYADLTIVTSSVPQIDVSVSASTAFGFLRETAPLTATDDGGTIRIGAAGLHGWTMGDDRMVTVLVPPETQVTVVGAGDIKANGLRAEASLKSIGRGTVTVEDFNAPALRVASSNGRIALRGIVAARLDAISKNDRVDGMNLQLRDGEVRSNDGVTLRFATGADTLVTADADNGRVRVSGLTPAASVVGTGPGAGNGDDDAAPRTVRVGAGRGRLDVHSTDGNITLGDQG